MAERRVILTLSDMLIKFLDRKSGESGIDRSNLIRMKLWEWVQEDRDLDVRERALKRKD
ncbi:MAG: hypothetical protein ACLQLH_03620 [Terracidiphilus sp.]